QASQDSSNGPYVAKGQRIMADITSSTYSVVTDSKTGDLYAIVRDGQLRKQTRDAMTSVTVGAAVAAVRNGGSTANRPTNPDMFEQYFDTTLGYLVVWDGMAWNGRSSTTTESDSIIYSGT